MSSQLARTRVTPIEPNSRTPLVTCPEISHGARTNSAVIASAMIVAPGISERAGTCRASSVHWLHQ